MKIFYVMDQYLLEYTILEKSPRNNVMILESKAFSIRNVQTCIQVNHKR